MGPPLPPPASVGGAEAADINDVLFGPTEASAASAAKRDPAEWEKAPAEIGPPDVDCIILPMVPVPKSKQGGSRAFDVRVYVEDAVESYLRVTGLTKLKTGWTPFCPKGSLPHADECEPGEAKGPACSVLMKGLGLARLSRPDMINPICKLASKVQCCTRVISTCIALSVI